MDVDVLLDKDLDVQLDSLREKLFLADKEATELRSELQLLEKQSVLSYECADSDFWRDFWLSMVTGAIKGLL
ncbi:hypothetical protein Sjap_003284 [Stephania japonica]|uniref:Uncharacterized protein n=1 Tax=Stephania japonica TaxID=461633 RepID=A0AAP0KQV4_9MAGN